MPDNARVLATYDTDQGKVSVARILGLHDPKPREWAAQCVAMETLRALMASGISIAAYNDMGFPEWAALAFAARDQAAARVPGAPVGELADDEVLNAANIGGNYFEHGYDTILAAQYEVVRFSKRGGMQ